MTVIRRKFVNVFLPSCMLPLITACVSSASENQAQSSISSQVPRLSQIPQTDGQISDSEWHGAEVWSLDDGVFVYFGRTQSTLCFAAKSRSRGPHYVDLFVAEESGRIVNYHASMRLGRRALTGDGWTDQDPPTVWDDMDGWYANLVSIRPDADPESDFAESVSPYDGIEICLASNNINALASSFRIEVRDFLGRRPDIVFPANSSRETTANWHTTQ